MELECSLPYSEQPTTIPQFDTDESSPHPHALFL